VLTGEAVPGQFALRHASAEPSVADALTDPLGQRALVDDDDATRSACWFCSHGDSLQPTQSTIDRFEIDCCGDTEAIQHEQQGWERRDDTTILHGRHVGCGKRVGQRCLREPGRQPPRPQFLARGSAECASRTVLRS
ncbi:MAG TPA: hypothetical protein VF178_14990, partial [Gemmatimonadaceae bacterium]